MQQIENCDLDPIGLVYGPRWNFSFKYNDLDRFKSNKEYPEKMDNYRLLKANFLTRY
jgi:hypothetical protein